MRGSAVVYPVNKLEGAVYIPSSKPHLQRALFLAFLNPHKTYVENISWDNESKILLDNLVILGLRKKFNYIITGDEAYSAVLDRQPQIPSI